MVGRLSTSPIVNPHRREVVQTAARGTRPVEQIAGVHRPASRYATIYRAGDGRHRRLEAHDEQASAKDLRRRRRNRRGRGNSDRFCGGWSVRQRGGRRYPRAVGGMPPRQRDQARHRDHLRQRPLRPRQPECAVRPRADAGARELHHQPGHVALEQPHAAHRAYRRRHDHQLHRPVRGPSGAGASPTTTRPTGQAER